LCDRKLHAAHSSSFCRDFTLYFTPYFTLLFALQGLAMNFDWYQERTKDESARRALQTSCLCCPKFTPYFTLLFALQGLAMNFDWYQERTKDESSTIGGWATALAYDFDMPGGYPAGVEVDWVSGDFC
jgi:trehalose/maltose hydrolase-like predicted phosphorylase